MLALEAVRLGAVIVTVVHLLALAINHYIGIARPLHYAGISFSPIVLYDRLTCTLLCHEVLSMIRKERK